jgi:hypothetical protein
MRYALCLLVFAGIGFCFSGSDTNQYLKLSEFRGNGKTRLVARNTSGRPVVAFVVAAVHRKTGQEDTTSVYSAVYSGKDNLASGKSINVGEWDTHETPPNVFVDYVRLADGTTWRNSVTEQGKEIAARFRN